MRAVRFRTAVLAPVAAALLSLPARADEAPAAPPRPSPAAIAAATAEAARYFPLAVGNEWTWADRSPQQPGAAPKTRTVRILSRDADGFYLDNERGALQASGGCIRDRSRRILCAPLEQGHAWSSVLSLTSTEHYRIEATGVPVKVPAGTFADCVVVRARNRAGDDADTVLEIAYAPGVGPVRLETWVEVKGRRIPQVRAELLSYRTERSSR